MRPAPHCQNLPKYFFQWNFDFLTIQDGKFWSCGLYRETVTEVVFLEWSSKRLLYSGWKYDKSTPRSREVIFYCWNYFSCSKCKRFLWTLVCIGGRFSTFTISSAKLHFFQFLSIVFLWKQTTSISFSFYLIKMKIQWGYYHEWWEVLAYRYVKVVFRVANTSAVGSVKLFELKCLISEENLFE